MTIVAIGVRLHDHRVMLQQRVRREPLPRKAHTACGGERLVLRSRRAFSPPVTARHFRHSNEGGLLLFVCRRPL